jgi:hypothetical protein
MVEWEEGKGVAPKNYKMGWSQGFVSKIGAGSYIGGAEMRCR